MSILDTNTNVALVEQCPTQFVVDGITFHKIDEMRNYFYRCLGLPVNSPGAPRWFSNDEMIKVTKDQK